MATANLIQTSVSGGTQNALALQGDGVFFPKASTASRLALTLTTTDKGFVVYDTTDSNIYFWNGTAWESIPGSGDSSNTQVIFNDNGILAGDAGLVYNKTTDALTVAGLVTAGSATITGALTVGAAANFNGGALAGYLNGNLMFGSGGNVLNVYAQSSGFALKDSSGAFNLLTAATTGFVFGDGAGGTRMTLNSTGLGVGVVPSSYKFEVGNGGSDTRAIFNPNNAFAIGVKNGSNQLGGWIGSAGNNILTFSGSDGTMKVTIDSAGNVGVGVTPSAWAAAVKALQIGAVGCVSYDGANYDIASNRYLASSGNSTYIANGFATMTRQVSGTHLWFNAPSGTAGNTITFTQAMTLDASGNLLVGKTASSTTVAGSQVQPDGTHSAVKSDANPGFFYNTTTAISGTIALFRSNGVTVGTITQDGTNTAYVTSSDYRLKESVAPLTGGLARVNALKPSIYNWKSNGSSGEGFLAHELADIVPAAVVGSKDAVNEDGTINPQGIDLSKVVPILVAAIQELTARVQTLEAR